MFDEKKKTIKGSTFEELNTTLLQCVNHVRSEGMPVSGPIIARKVKEPFEMLGLQGTFDTLSGWLRRFKQWPQDKQN